MSRFWLILPILVNSRSKNKNYVDHRSYKKVTTADLSLQIEKLRERIDELEKNQDFGDFVSGEITSKRSKRNSWQNIKVKFPRSVIENVCKPKAGTQGPPGKPGKPGSCPSECPKGPKGSTGERGFAGRAGLKGSSGRNGGPGSAGQKGCDGARGLMGRTGKQGFKGSTGMIGKKGTRGFHGTKGQKGCPGVCESSYCGRGGGRTGPAGPRGLPGKPGRHGEPGTDGRPGEMGRIGEKGEFGETGAKGEPGVDGESGKDGIPGERGLQGQKGSDGLEAEDGEKGDKGDSGDTGKHGPPGAPGIPGEAGQTGEPGAPGTPGENGSLVSESGVISGQKGEKGDNGAIGLSGRDGERGLDGLPGVRGEPGLKGDEGEDGFDGINGEPGKNGKDGVNGTDGKNGEDGKNGINGQNGINGTNGEPGKTGEKGESGPPGIPGERGIQGLTGTQNLASAQTAIPGGPGLRGPPGLPGHPGTSGRTGVQGPPGSTGAQGVQGERGVQGFQGLRGLPGPRGDKGNTGQNGESGENGLPGLTGKVGKDGNDGKDGKVGPKGQKGDSVQISGSTFEKLPNNLPFEKLPKNLLQIKKLLSKTEFGSDFDWNSINSKNSELDDQNTVIWFTVTGGRTKTNSKLANTNYKNLKISRNVRGNDTIIYNVKEIGVAATIIAPAKISDSSELEIEYSGSGADSGANESDDEDIYEDDQDDQVMNDSPLINNPIVYEKVMESHRNFDIIRNFTTCGTVTSRKNRELNLGPSLKKCKKFLNCEHDKSGICNELIDISGGVQIWKVPETGVYKIIAHGGKGGNLKSRADLNAPVIFESTISNGKGGRGSKISGKFKLFKNEKLFIIVGQKGETVSQGENNVYSAGNGGSSFIYKMSKSRTMLQPLIVASGGQGSSSSRPKSKWGFTQDCKNLKCLIDLKTELMIKDELNVNSEFFEKRFSGGESSSKNGDVEFGAGGFGIGSSGSETKSMQTSYNKNWLDDAVVGEFFKLPRKKPVYDRNGHGFVDVMWIDSL